MKITLIGQGARAVAQVCGEGMLIASAQDMLDLIATASYAHNCRRLILDKESVSEDFFSLKTGLAGDILQKVVNYGAALAIVGDFSGYGSNALKDLYTRATKAAMSFLLAATPRP